VNFHNLAYVGRIDPTRHQPQFFIFIWACVVGNCLLGPYVAFHFHPALLGKRPAFVVENFPVNDQTNHVPYM